VTFHFWKNFPYLDKKSPQNRRKIAAKIENRRKIAAKSPQNRRKNLQDSIPDGSTHNV
jgi:hypothetical protein